MFKQGVLAASILAAMVAGSAGAVTVEELQAQIKAQQAQLDALAAQMEQQQAGATGGEWFRKTTIGGYGEIHYSHMKRTRGNDALDPTKPAYKGDKNGDSLDFHRFVIYVAHQYSDSVRFFSELEVEHALTGGSEDPSKSGKPGEIELEQAYIDWRYAQNHHLVSGLFLLPVGFFNEVHEPDTFYGVERPAVEQQVIPAVWWEGGVMAQGELAPGVKYDLAVTSGLNDKDGKIRDGRQKVAKANADDHAYTARIRYTGLPGLDVGLTYQRQQDITQGDATIARVGKNFGQADLVAAHVAFKQGPVGLRAVYAQWDLDGDRFTASGRDDQYGWYVEPSFKITEKVGVFARYSEWDLTNGSGDNKESRVEQTLVGANYWLNDRVVFKFDVQNENAANGTDKEGFNLGMGYSF